ncbi:MAG: recombinase family protein [Eubacterium sp.]|jgi:DNA invertase Pin-like site-specific DNA recombinase|nr:recombinase family protein [Eubacterium sp.]
MQKDIIWNANGYVRLSKDDKDKDESNSIKNQRDLILDFASSNPAICVVDILSDDGFTGANFEREAFKQMIRNIEAGTINCVIVKDVSRLGRDHIGTGRYIEKYFREKKVRFISINDNFDSLTADMSDSNNSLIIPFKNIINEAFLEDISLKTKSQLEIKRKNGEFVSNYPVYGYLKSSGKKLVIDDYAADIVKNIFEYKIHGYNEQQIAAILNEKGVLPPSEYKRSVGIAYNTPFAVKEKALWSVNTIKRILTNRVYIGHLEQGKRTKASYRMTKILYKPQEDWSIHPNNHEPVIASSDFALVQELLAKDTRVSAESRQLHLLSGFIICGQCGQPMIIKTTKIKGRKYIYFVCSARKKYGSCKSNSIRDEAILKFVLISIKQQIASLLSKVDITGSLGTDTLQSRQQLAIEGLIENNLAIIRENKDYLVKAYEHFVEGVITEAEYAMFKASFNKQVENAENTIAGLREQITKLKDNAQNRTLVDIRAAKLRTNRTLLKRRWVKMARKSRKFTQVEIPATKAPLYDTWVYARISNETERSEDSIENQIAIGQEYISGKNDLAFRGVFTDLGFSGTNFDRPDYEKMLAGIRKGTVQCVVVKDLSRLGRTYIELGELLFDIFPAFGVRFISVNDRYDSFDASAGRQKLLILFKNLVNHMYSKDLDKKIKSTFVTKQQKGELLGSTPPYGYKFTTAGKPKRLEIEPQAAKVVKQIFDLRLQGWSTVKITEYLNANNIPTPGLHYYQIGLLAHEKYAAKTIWQNSFIIKLLVNEVYTGNQVQGKYARSGKKYIEKPKSEWIIHKHTHPDIVSAEQFETVQQLMAEAGRKYKKHGNKLDENIFVGKVFCSRCGKAAKREYYRGKNKINYCYHCRNCDAELRRSLGLKTIKPVALEVMESAVGADIQARIKSCLDIDGLLTKISRSAVITHKRHRLLQERDKFAKDGKKAEELLAAAYAHHLSGVLSEGEFELARSKFERDKQTASVCFTRIEQELAEYEIGEIQKNECLKNFRAFKSFEKLDKAIIDALVHRIEITPLANEVKVILNFRDSFEKLEALASESGVMANVS